MRTSAPTPQRVVPLPAPGSPGAPGAPSAQHRSFKDTLRELALSAQRERGASKARQHQQGEGPRSQYTDQIRGAMGSSVPADARAGRTDHAESRGTTPLQSGPGQDGDAEEAAVAAGDLTGASTPNKSVHGEGSAVAGTSFDERADSGGLNGMTESAASASAMSGEQGTVEGQSAGSVVQGRSPDTVVQHVGPASSAQQRLAVPVHVEGQPMTIVDLNRLLLRVGVREAGATDTPPGLDQRLGAAPQRWSTPMLREVQATLDTGQQHGAGDFRAVESALAARTFGGEPSTPQYGSERTGARKSAPRATPAEGGGRPETGDESPRDTGAARSSASEPRNGHGWRDGASGLLNEPRRPGHDSSAPAPSAERGTKSLAMAQAGAGDSGAGGVRGRAAAPSERTSRGSEAQDTSLRAQVARGVMAAANQRGGSVVVRLQPETLGQLRVHIDSSRGSLAVRLDVGSEQARGLLRQSMGELRAALAERGLNVDQPQIRLDPILAQEKTPGSVHGPWQERAADESDPWNGRKGSNRGAEDQPSQAFRDGVERRTSGHESQEADHIIR